MSKLELDGLAKATAIETATAIAEGKLSSVEAVEAAIDRIERLDGPINAVVVRDFDRARAAAKAADEAVARGERGPLLGVPMTVKEAHNVAGLPTTWGLEEYKGWIAPEDSVGVARLKAAGAIIVGKTNVPPNLADWQSGNKVYGLTRHHLDPERTVGGSSGGSAAALGAGMVPLEFGSDIGGSIRVPSGFCGVFGHKPTWNIVPTRGHSFPGMDGAEPELAVIGPMARSADDLALALDILAGPDGEEAHGWRLDLQPSTLTSLKGARVLILDHHPVARVQGEIVSALHRLAGNLESEGARVERDSNRLPELARAHEIYMGLLTAIMSRGSQDFGEPPNVHVWMAGLDAQVAMRREWARLFADFDIVLAPTFGVVAFPHDRAPFAERKHVIDGVETVYGDQLAWPGMATLAKLPATAFPIGSTKAGLPISAQAIGPYLGDRTTIAFAGLAAEAAK